MSPKVSRGFSATRELLQPEQTWIVAPVQTGYPHSPGVTVANIGEVLQALRLLNESSLNPETPA
jgi:hypothetical protein